MESKTEAGSGSAKIPPLPHRRENGGRKKSVLLSFGEERIEGAQTLTNESEEGSFREMLTST